MMLHKIDCKFIWGSVPKPKYQCSKTVKFWKISLALSDQAKTHILDPNSIEFDLNAL